MNINLLSDDYSKKKSKEVISLQKIHTAIQKVSSATRIIISLFISGIVISCVAKNIPETEIKSPSIKKKITGEREPKEITVPIKVYEKKEEKIVKENECDPLPASPTWEDCVELKNCEGDIDSGDAVTCLSMLVRRNQSYNTGTEEGGVSPEENSEVGPETKPDLSYVLPSIDNHPAIMGMEEKLDSAIEELSKPDPEHVEAMDRVIQGFNDAFASEYLSVQRSDPGNLMLNGLDIRYKGQKVGQIMVQNDGDHYLVNLHNDKYRGIILKSDIVKGFFGNVRRKNISWKNACIEIGQELLGE